MFSLYGTIINNPGQFRQLRCGETLMSVYNCPLENKLEDTWSHHNYIVYVMEGHKIWHTAQGSYDLQKNSCVFVRKGACIVEQFFEVTFCLVVFFIPDAFICEVLKSRSVPVRQPGKKFDPVMPVEADPAVKLFFASMMPHFDTGREPDPALLELKFRELILHIAGNPANSELLSFFSSLQHEPRNLSLQRIMEDNYCYNLGLEEFARLCNRSLSAFKRDFEKQFQTSPGKWLLEKRLNHAFLLLSNTGKTVSEAAFECGFENPSHFSRAFKARYGIAPQSARKIGPA